MLGWIVLAVIVALVCLLLSAKVGARVVFGEELKVWVKAGPAMILVYPRPEKKKDANKVEKKAKKQKEADEKEKQQEKRRITFDAVWQLITELLGPLLDMMERVRKGMHIRCLTLHLTVSDLNPAVAAKRYGQMNALLWPFLAAVENVVAVERRDVRVGLDYAAHHSSVEGEVFITMRLYHGFCILLVDGLKILSPVLRFIKITKPSKDTQKDQNKTPKNSVKTAA